MEVYTYRIRKVIGAYSAVLGKAVLGKVDAVIFTAGIGENSAEIRAGCCDGLGALGIDLDATANARGTGDVFGIHKAGSRVAVLVVDTNEELEIAAETLELVR